MEGLGENQASMYPERDSKYTKTSFLGNFTGEFFIFSDRHMSQKLHTFFSEDTKSNLTILLILHDFHFLLISRLHPAIFVHGAPRAQILQCSDI